MKKILLISLVFVSFSLAGQTQGYPRLIKDDNGLVIRDDSNHLILEDWQPTSESNLSFWLRADDAGTGGTVSKDANNYVSQWADCSGNNAISYEQPTAASQPLWIDNFFNGKPVIRFDATNDRLVAATELSLPNPCTVIIVSFRYGGPILSGGTNTNPYLYTDVNQHPICSAYDGFGSPYYYGSLSNLNIETMFLYTTGLTNTLYNQTTYQKSRISTTTTSYFNYLGWQTTAGYGVSYKYVTEIIVYNSTLNTAQYTRVINYLKAKYNL